MDTKERWDAEQATYLYKLNSIDLGIDKAEEIYDMYERVDDEAHKYGIYIESQMETDGVIDDKKARTVCKEISAKYLR